MKKLGVTAVAWLLGAAWAGGQAPATRPPMAEEVFKNVQILKGIPVDEFMGTMGFFSASLGLNCTDCHVDESGGDWARYADDNPKKRTARRMMQMVTDLNRVSFGGRQVVTCNTCHRGNSRPNVQPSLGVSADGHAAARRARRADRAGAGQPPAERVLDKYLQAVGGADKLSAITSLTARGTYRGFDDQDKSAVEIFASAPGQRTTVVHTLSGESTTTYDGREGWIAAPDVEKPMPVFPITGQELDGVKLEVELWFPSRIKQALTRWRVGAPAVLGDREVMVVQGNTANGATATLCFDSNRAAGGLSGSPSRRSPSSRRWTTRTTGTSRSGGQGPPERSA
jgi:hypothetical protein